MHSHRHNEVQDGDSQTLKRLSWSFGITTLVMIIEAVGGWLAGSIALVSDAGHMLTHAFAIAISVFGLLIARLPACHHRTFGLLRAEIVAAFVNALFLLAVTVWIVVESVQRLINPRSIVVSQMLAIAGLGLLVNVISILLLESRRRGNLNVQAVFMHMVSDAASSVAIVLAAIVIRFTQWVWLDPVVSMGIALLIVIWAGRLLRESLRVLLEMAPRGRTVKEIIDALQAEFPQVIEAEHEHVWTITPAVICFSAHLTVDASELPAAGINDWLHNVERWLADTFDISESTLQVWLLNLKA
jgi:cobalt-zinc-cadmium efflux system protein